MSKSTFIVRVTPELICQVLSTGWTTKGSLGERRITCIRGIPKSSRLVRVILDRDLVLEDVEGQDFIILYFTCDSAEAPVKDGDVFNPEFRQDSLPPFEELKPLF